MSYTPINWQTGDTITAEKMNKMDNGWGAQSTQLFSETVTTVAREYGNEAEITLQKITQNELTVTFNGATYTCQRIYIASDNANGYGGVTDEWSYDFTNYPFAIVSQADTTIFATQTAGTYAVAVNAQDIVVSESFSTAVNECVDTSYMPFRCVSGETTYDEMQAAMVDEGRMLYFTVNSYCYYITNFATNVIHYFPESSQLTVAFVDGVFTVTLI